MSSQDSPLTVAEALEHFNKAEPDLMIRDAFGHRKKKLCLDTSFRERLENEAKLGQVPDDAWWAVEYPFTCLVGALALYAQGKQAFHQKWVNNAAEKGRVAASLQHAKGGKVGSQNKHKGLPRLATSGREDVDFIISFENKIILLEAKGYTSFKNSN
jgi:hypothetical protein